MRVKSHTSVWGLGMSLCGLRNRLVLIRHQSIWLFTLNLQDSGRIHSALRLRVGGVDCGWEVRPRFRMELGHLAVEGASLLTLVTMYIRRPGFSPLVL